MNAALDVLALQAGEGERLSFGPVTILVRAHVGGERGSVLALRGSASACSDTPLHVHRNEDELFYVLEGEHVYRVGDTEHTVGPGGFVFAPRGVPHSQRRVVPGEGRELVLTTPGGFEGFFRELARAQEAGRSARTRTRPPPSGSASPGSERSAARRVDGLPEAGSHGLVREHPHDERSSACVVHRDVVAEHPA